MELYQSGNICILLLREYFEIFSHFEELFREGLKFFQQFPDLIKSQKFNSIKAFLFFFAYQTNKFSSPMVKELLSQELINAKINDREEYLDFCVYCFHYFLNRNFFYLNIYLKFLIF